MTTTTSSMARKRRVRLGGLSGRADDESGSPGRCTHSWAIASRDTDSMVNEPAMSDRGQSQHATTSAVAMQAPNIPHVQLGKPEPARQPDPSCTATSALRTTRGKHPRHPSHNRCGLCAAPYGLARSAQRRASQVQRSDGGGRHIQPCRPPRRAPRPQKLSSCSQQDSRGHPAHGHAVGAVPGAGQPVACAGRGDGLRHREVPSSELRLALKVFPLLALPAWKPHPSLPPLKLCLGRNAVSCGWRAALGTAGRAGADSGGQRRFAQERACACERPSCWTQCGQQCRRQVMPSHRFASGKRRNALGNAQAPATQSHSAFGPSGFTALAVWPARPVFSLQAFASQPPARPNTARQVPLHRPRRPRHRPCPQARTRPWLPQRTAAPRHPAPFLTSCCY